MQEVGCSNRYSIVHLKRHCQKSSSPTRTIFPFVKLSHSRKKNHDRYVRHDRSQCAHFFKELMVGIVTWLRLFFVRPEQAPDELSKYLLYIERKLVASDFDERTWMLKSLFCLTQLSPATILLRVDLICKVLHTLLSQLVRSSDESLSMRRLVVKVIMNIKSKTLEANQKSEELESLMAFIGRRNDLRTMARNY
uniref:Uncharacterized protein n=1 Tax=Ditylenchus dipsaci TaxID=166011 RepID=A0A915E184_9BILA